MKRILILALVGLFGLGLALPTEAATMAQKLKGKILLQVESKGEAWYIHPFTMTRHSLGRPDDAFKVMREQGLGISEEDYAKMIEKAPAKFAGRILLRVKSKGEAYYVHPTTFKLYFLGRPADAFKVMRELGLGIKDTDLNLISESIKNCGNAYSDGLPELEYVKTDDGSVITEKINDYDQDAGLVCFGKALLNNCQPAKLTIINEMGTKHTEEIIGSKGKYCVLKVEYTNVAAGDEESETYANSKLQCDFPSSEIAGQACNMVSNAACAKFNLKKSPGQTAVRSFGSMLLAALFTPKQITCSGDMIAKMTSMK